MLISVPAFARRRAVTPGDPAHCMTGTLAAGAYASLMAADDDHVYFIDGFGIISRVPKSGGAEEMLTNPFEDGLRDWLPMSMVVDATHVYIGALPVEAIFSPMPGAIFTMPKDGGVPGVLVSGVITPIALALDETHVYWASSPTRARPRCPRGAGGSSGDREYRRRRSRANGAVSWGGSIGEETRVSELGSSGVYVARARVLPQDPYG